MFVRSIWLQDFLSFNASPALWLDLGLTVITGPNGAGKSNLARSLDVARAVLAPHDHPDSGRLDLYREAGFEGATEFTIKLEMVLNQSWEQDLVRTHVQAAYLTSGLDQSPQTADSLEKSVDWLVADSLIPLIAGTLVIRYRATAARPWAAYWEFSDEDSGATWHVVLADDQGIDQLRPGEAGEPERASGGMRFVDWLMQAKPQDATELDFRVAMRIATEQPVNFSVGSSQSGRIPGSVRELALGLGIRADGARRAAPLVEQRPYRRPA